MTNRISTGNSPRWIRSIKFLRVVPPPEIRTAIGNGGDGITWVMLVDSISTTRNELHRALIHSEKEMRNVNLTESFANWQAGLPPSDWSVDLQRSSGIFLVAAILRNRKALNRMGIAIAMGLPTRSQRFGVLNDWARPIPECRRPSFARPPTLWKSYFAANRLGR